MICRIKRSACVAPEEGRLCWPMKQEHRGSRSHKVKTLRGVTLSAVTKRVIRRKLRWTLEQKARLLLWNLPLTTANPHKSKHNANNASFQKIEHLPSIRNTEPLSGPLCVSRLPSSLICQGQPPVSQEQTEKFSFSPSSNKPFTFDSSCERVHLFFIRCRNVIAANGF